VKGWEGLSFSCSPLSLSPPPPLRLTPLVYTLVECRVAWVGVCVCERERDGRGVLKVDDGEEVRRVLQCVAVCCGGLRWVVAVGWCTAVTADWRM